MKIAITGHSQGLGQSIFEHLISQGHEVEGFSRSNGWDLNMDPVKQNLIKYIKNSNFDCFINSAYPYGNNTGTRGFMQVDLLNQIWTAWKTDSSKVIIVISSIGAENTKNEFHPYAIHKRALNDTVKQLRKAAKNGPQIINIKPGYIDTPAVASFTNEKKCAPQQVAELISWSLASPLKILDLMFTAK